VHSFRPSRQNRKTPVPEPSYPWGLTPLRQSLILKGRTGARPNDLLCVLSRNTWTLYDIDLRTGPPSWRLRRAPASSFQSQGRVALHLAAARTPEFFSSLAAELDPFRQTARTPPKESIHGGLPACVRTGLRPHTVALVKQVRDRSSKTLSCESQVNASSPVRGVTSAGLYGPAAELH